MHFKTPLCLLVAVFVNLEPSHNHVALLSSPKITFSVTWPECTPFSSS